MRKKNEMTEFPWILIPLFFLISVVYTSVGLGGGSSYVAVLVLLGLPLVKIPPIVLFLNILAASVALYRFSKKGYFVTKIVLPFLVSSIPATFFSSYWRPDERVLSLIFAGALLLVSLALFFKKKDVKRRISLGQKSTLAVSFLLGALLGFLAGVMGIGGGVFLGPVLLLIGMASPKQVAAICSAFVLVNSVVGLVSHSLSGGVDFLALGVIGLAVFAGAQIGSFLGSEKFSPLVLQRIFAVLLLSASLMLGFGVLA